MESCISKLAYKGSISEAILESKAQKKLFVVYISGKNSESAGLENSTWTDAKVAETLSKYCILLHVLEGTDDAMNFSAIYPQKSVPAIAVIGYNGVQLWQSEGCTSVEVLVSSLEKSYLSLHIQETTANVLTVALANKKSEPSASGSSDGVSLGYESSSAIVSSSSTVRNMESTEVPQHTASPTIDDNQFHENRTEDDENATPGPVSAKILLRVEDEQSQPSTGRAQVFSNPSATNLKAVEYVPSGAEKNHAVQEVGIDNSRMSEQPTASVTPIKNGVQHQYSEAINNDSRVDASNDVHLNIKLLNGTSLKEKFLVSSTLRMVKDRVDSNQESGNVPYNLAIPYPRKVFGERDLDRSLSELGLSNRQALIVVPCQGGVSYYTTDYSSSAQNTTLSDPTSVGGYFGYVRRALSLINPLSYVGGSSSSTLEPVQNGIWQYSPNPAPQISLGTVRPNYADSASQRDPAAGTNDVRRRKQPSAAFGSGSNIHTLRRAENDDQLNGRNAFWNGNSTQFSGDSNDPKP